MTKREAIRWVRSQNEDNDLDYDETVEAFRAIFGREPDAEDEETCSLWDHLCQYVYA